MIYIPIIGSILEAGGMIIEKKILRKKSVNYKNYTVFGFLAIVLIMIPFLYFFWNIKQPAFELKNLVLFFLVVISALIANLLTFYSLKRENLTELEPIRLMQPLFTILLAVLIFSSERNWKIVILAIIASLTLIASHIKKSHWVYDKYIIAMLFGSLFFAIELVLSKFILEYYSSFTFYFLRCLIILLITLAIFKTNLKSIGKKNEIMIMIVGIMWIIYRILLYYGYEIYGLVFTTILFILTPVFIYTFARIFLKEKLKLRNIIATIIIIACVVAAIMLEN
jgi:drug/metabolite transporter (DMT)-like permease